MWAAKASLNEKDFPRPGEDVTQVTKRGVQGAALGAAVCRMRGPPKGRSRRRAPQEGAEAVIRKGKRVKLDVLRGLTEPLSHASRASSPEKESQEQEFSPQKTN